MLNTTQKAAIRWQCRRGMLELDLLLQRFCLYGLESLTSAELIDLKRLLQLPDPDLLVCLMGYADPIDVELTHVVARIQSYLTPR